MNKRITTKQAIKRWDQHAEAFTAGYDEQGGVHREVLLNPAIFSLMENIEGAAILDAGCGEGYLSRMLAKKGARVTSVDFSGKMLEIAEQRTVGNYNIYYYYGNLENLDFLENASFDVIVSNMVIQDLEDYESALKEMYRTLKMEGSLIFSILHPCFVTPFSGWVRDSNGDKQYWKINKYFQEGVYEQPFPAECDEKIVFYHRTLTSYFKTIQKIGFTLEELVEPEPSEDMIKKYPQFVEDLNFSNFLVFKLRK